MKLTTLVRNLEKQLKTAEKLARRYDAEAKAIGKKLETVASAVGKAISGKISGRGISTAGRKRIAKAQRARWKKFHAKQKSKKQGKKSENPF
jgi:hypothetical protein